MPIVSGRDVRFNGSEPMLKDVPFWVLGRTTVMAFQLYSNK